MRSQGGLQGLSSVCPATEEEGLRHHRGKPARWLQARPRPAGPMLSARQTLSGEPTDPSRDAPHTQLSLQIGTGFRGQVRGNWRHIPENKIKGGQAE